MSFNIVDLVKDQVKGQLIGHMGNLLGNEGGKATSAVDSMIPALLNGMTGSAGTDEGASTLFGAIQDQDDSMLDNIGSLLEGGQASTVIDNGNSVLSNLFGAGGLGKLAGALSAFSGVSKGGTSSLMGMLAPIVLGVLKRKVMGDGLNAGGLASMLSSQGNNVAAALPQGLSDQLNTSGFLSSIGGAGAGLAAGAAGAVAAGASNLADGARDAASSAAGSVSDAAGAVGDGVANAASGARDAAGSAVDSVAGAAGSARDGVANAAGAVGDGVSNAADAVGDGAKKGGSMFRWLLPLIVLGALAWAAMKFLAPGAKDAAGDAADAVSDGAAAVTETASDAASTATEAASDAVSTATEAASDAVSTATEAASDAVSTATDAASDATAAVTEAASSATDSMAVADPAEVGNQLSGLFSSATETLGGISDLDSAKAALPALGELGENVDSVSGMLNSLPQAARGPLNTVAAEGFGKLKPVVEKVMALPGVGDIVSPVLSPIMEKMQELGS